MARTFPDTALSGGGGGHPGDGISIVVDSF